MHFFLLVIGCPIHPHLEILNIKKRYKHNNNILKLMIINRNYYYRFIVRFPVRLEFPLLLFTHDHEPCYWGSPIFPLVVHHPASPSVCPAVQLLRRGLPTNPGVTTWSYVGVVEEMMCVVCVSVTGEGIMVMDVI